MISATNVFLIPTFKPSNKILALVKDLRTSTSDPIIIVDDGSGTRYSSIFDGLAEIERVDLLAYKMNRGKGFALKTGLLHVAEKYHDATYAITLDADGQHKVSDVLKVAEAATRARGALVLGARLFDTHVPFRSRFGNSISRFVYRLVLGRRISDTQTGLRAIPRQFWRTSISIRFNRYEYETEQLARAVAEAMDILEVPIETVYEEENASSHFNPLLDSLRIYFVIVRYAFSSILTAIADFAIFYLAFGIIGEVVASNVFSRAVGLIVQFDLLKKIVFRQRGGVIRFITFALYALLMGAVSGTVQTMVSGTLSVGVLWAKLITESLLFFLNVFVVRQFIFNDRDE